MLLTAYLRMLCYFIIFLCFKELIPSMDGDIIPRCLLLLFLVFFAGIFTGSETAYSYCNRVRMKTLAEEGSAAAKRVNKIIERFDKTVVTTLVCINVIYVGTSSLATVIAVDLMGEATGSLAASIIMTLMIFIFSESIPKNFAKANCDKFALTLSLPILLLMKVLTPVSFIFTTLGNIAKKLLQRGEKAPSMTEDEFSTIVESVEEEVIEEAEKEIIQSAIEFGDLTVKEVMTPKEDIIGIDKHMSDEDKKNILCVVKYSRIPVYDGNIDNIVGILRTGNCLWQLMHGRKPDSSASMKKPLYVLPDTKLDTIFEEMSHKRSHIAIVADENKKTLGLITMEDILEQIVGEIYDEDDVARPLDGKKEASIS